MNRFAHWLRTFPSWVAFLLLALGLAGLAVASAVFGTCGPEVCP